MTKFRNVRRALTWFTALLFAAAVAGCIHDDDGNGGSNLTPTDTGPGAGSGVDGAGQGPAPIDLGAAEAFAILAETAIVNVSTSSVNGDVGVSPSTGAGIDITCDQVTGIIYDVDNMGPPACTVQDPDRLNAAVGAKAAAYTDAAGRVPDYTDIGAGNIGGLNLSPGTYRWSTAVSIPSDVTLTGTANDVWIFQIAGGLTVAPGVQVVLAGGALPENVFWQTFGAVDLGATSTFNGVILSQTSITMGTDASIDGRMLAGTAVVLDQSTVTQPAPKTLAGGFTR